MAKLILCSRPRHAGAATGILEPAIGLEIEGSPGVEV